MQGVDLLEELVADLDPMGSMEAIIEELRRFDPEELIAELNRADRELFEGLQNALKARE